MKNWVIPVYAEVGALIDVQANSLKEAMDKVNLNQNVERIIICLRHTEMV